MWVSCRTILYWIHYMFKIWMDNMSPLPHSQIPGSCVLRDTIRTKHFLSRFGRWGSCFSEVKSNRLRIKIDWFRVNFISRQCVNMMTHLGINMCVNMMTHSVCDISVNMMTQWYVSYSRHNSMCHIEDTPLTIVICIKKTVERRPWNDFVLMNIYFYWCVEMGEHVPVV